MHPLLRLVAIAIFCLTLPLQVPAQPRHPSVLLETSMGDVVIALDTEAAPQTVDNFLHYVTTGFYGDTIFHRVIKGFMIQGGGMTSDMRKKKTAPPISNEADNGLANTTGTIAMARTSNPHSATSQFFINVADNNFLDHKNKTASGWGYCVFGRVVKGMEIVKAIENVPTAIRSGRRDVPVKPVVIKRASVMEKPKPSKTK